MYIALRLGYPLYEKRGTAKDFLPWFLAADAHGDKSPELGVPLGDGLLGDKVR